MSEPYATVRLQRMLDAPVERVFRALTDPAVAVQWWGPADVRTSAVEIDLRVGGRCRWVMHPDGGRAVLHGEIVELDPPRLLVMTNRGRATRSSPWSPSAWQPSAGRPASSSCTSGFPAPSIPAGTTGGGAPPSTRYPHT